MIGRTPSDQSLVAGPPLKALDRFLCRWRSEKAHRHIPDHARVLDVGCHDGALFRQLGERLSFGLGIDPLLTRAVETERYRLMPGLFPSDAPEGAPFDAIVLLAVVEHIPEHDLTGFAEACLRFLKPGGVIVCTVPSEAVDRLLHWLSKAHLIAGMSVHQHHGLKPSQVARTFAGSAVVCIREERFQLGLNNLFVFKKLPA